MNQMLADGLTEVIEIGPGKVLQGLFKKVDRALPCSSAEMV
jgi:[acyl-carrier-protein] S-malonyltransferase